VLIFRKSKAGNELVAIRYSLLLTYSIFVSGTLIAITVVV
ncbi:uncharacterized protein METZ01_LOCUS416153, partial [marine metagenome]